MLLRRPPKSSENPARVLDSAGFFAMWMAAILHRKSRRSFAQPVRLSSWIAIVRRDFRSTDFLSNTVVASGMASECRLPRPRELYSIVSPSFPSRDGRVASLRAAAAQETGPPSHREEGVSVPSACLAAAARIWRLCQLRLVAVSTSNRPGGIDFRSQLATLG